MADQPTLSNLSQADLTNSLTTLHVRVRDRVRVIFEKDARAITTYSDTGLFDILPQHTNFISLIKQAIIVHTIDGQKATIPINNGLMKVKANTVHCYVNLISGK